MKRAIIYVRVSTDAQERDGTSLDTQEKACLEHATASGGVVVETIRDTASGFTLDRPGAERLRALMRDGRADVLVSYAVDRLSRNQNHIGVLFDEAEQAGVELDFVTEKFEDTAIGRFILAARAFVAEVEREKISERTMRGKEARARSGRLPQGTGKGMYGYTYDRDKGRREVAEKQAIIVRRLFTGFASGASTVGLTNELNAEGVPTFAGAQWTPATVYHLLRNPGYIGHSVYRQTRVVTIRDARTGRRKRSRVRRDVAEQIELTDVTPRIIDDEVFAAVQQRLDDPERRRRGQRKYDYPLGGRLRCAKCGRAVVGQTLQGKYRYYRCRSAFAGPRHDRCDSRYVRGVALEAAIRREVARVLADPAIILAELERVAEGDGADDRSGAIEREIAQADDRHKRLVQLYEWGEIDEASFKADAGRLRADRDQLTARATPVRPARPIPPADMDSMAAACRAVTEWVADADGDDFDLLLDALDLSAIVSREGGELIGTIPYAPTDGHADVRSMVTNS